MDERMRDGMAEATRLTQAGRLAEATALIQRLLRGLPVDDVSEARKGRVKDAIEAEFWVVPDTPPAEGKEADFKDIPTKEKHGGQEYSTRTTGGHKGPSPASPPHPPLRDMPMFRFSPNVQHKPKPEKLSSINGGGQFVNGRYSNADSTRAYQLYIPSSYRGQAVPLMVMLHGCTQTPLDFATGTQMNVLAEEQTFLVAYPQQAQGANSSRCWNWFQAADQQRDAGEPSLIAGMTQQIMSKYRVDATRVYVAGMSAGGAMAVVMAVTYPDLYAAVGVHSGLAYGAAHDLPSGFVAMTQGASQQVRQVSGAIPLIVFHGDRDTTVAPVNADHLVEQWLRASNNGSRRETRVERGKAASGHAYSRFTYVDASGRTIVEKWLVHQAGHAWSGGSAGGSFTDPKGPDASAEMLRFFNEHPKKRQHR